MNSSDREVRHLQVHATSRRSPFFHHCIPALHLHSAEIMAGPLGWTLKNRYSCPRTGLSFSSAPASYIFWLSPSSKLLMFTVRESGTFLVDRMNHSAHLYASPARCCAVRSSSPTQDTTSPAAILLEPRKGYTIDAERPLPLDFSSVRRCEKVHRVETS